MPEGRLLQHLLPRPRHRDAAAAHRGSVPLSDGTAATIVEMARDVSPFRVWAAEPKLEERHQLGARVMVFLIVFAIIMFLAKRAVWGRLHGKAPHTA